MKCSKWKMIDRLSSRSGRRLQAWTEHGGEPTATGLSLGLGIGTSTLLLLWCVGGVFCRMRTVQFLLCCFCNLFKHLGFLRIIPYTPRRSWSPERNRWSLQRGCHSSSQISILIYYLSEIWISELRFVFLGFGFHYASLPSPDHPSLSQFLHRYFRSPHFIANL